MVVLLQLGLFQLIFMLGLSEPPPPPPVFTVNVLVVNVVLLAF